MAATNKTPATRTGRTSAKRGSTPARVIPMVPVKVAGKSVEWVQNKPQERYPHVVAAGVYASGVVAAHAGASPLYIMLGTVSAAGIGYVATIKKTNDDQIAGLGAMAVVAAGSWIAAAAHFGVLWGHLWGPFHMATLAFLLPYLVLYRKYRKTERLTVKVKSRDDQMWWMEARDSWRLPNTNLIELKPTRLGAKYVVNVMGMGKTAAQVATKPLENWIAALHKLPSSRVKARVGSSEDRIVIYIRFIDPWAKPIPHPLLDAEPEIALSENPSVNEPAVIGQDPETGKPLNVELVDPEEGANRIMVVGMSGAGKTVLVNDLLERLTACRDTMVCCIDLSKGKEMRRFRNKGALGPSAIGKKERLKALKILEMACEAIAHRSEQSEVTDDAVHRARPGAPAIVLVLDEVDALFEAQDNIAAGCARALNTLLSKGRSEMVSTIMIGQRGTAKWMGGANIRANFNVHVILKVQRQGEMRLAMGDATHVPDMSKYGEGHKGVAIVVKDDHFQAGRTFKLRELTDLDDLAEGRSPSELEPDLVQALGKPWAKLVNGDYDAARQPAMAGAGGGTFAGSGAGSADGPFGNYAKTSVDEELGLDGDADEDAEEYAAEELGADSAPGDPAAATIDPLSNLDAQMEEALPEDLRRERLEKTMDRAQEKLNEAREVIGNRKDIPKPTPEQEERLRAAAEERWRQLAANTEISPGHMKTIMELIERPQGASSSEIANATGIPKTNMWRVIKKLTLEGVAHRVPPSGRNARIYAGAAPDAGEAKAG